MSDECLPCCPTCGVAVSSATQTRGRLKPDDPLLPGIAVLTPCGHVLKAGTEEYRDWSLQAFQWAQRRIA
jgi:hypothetical protein